MIHPGLRNENGDRYDKPVRFAFPDDPSWYHVLLQLREKKRKREMTGKECTETLLAVSGAPDYTTLINFS